jgi:hypothetical protein
LTQPPPAKSQAEETVQQKLRPGGTVQRAGEARQRAGEASQLAGEATAGQDIKGTESRDFLLLVLFMNQFPPAPEYSIKTVSNFFENSLRYSQLKVCPVANGKNLQSEKF